MEKESLESQTIDKEHVENILSQNIKYFIEHNTIYTYEVVKKIIYNYNNRDTFIKDMFDKDTEKMYAKEIYLKIANKIFTEYDKIYKAREKQQRIVIQRPRQAVTRRTTRRNRHTGLGIAYCLGCGIYGFMKGLTK